MKKMITALTATLLALTLAACGGGGLTTFDATAYIQGLMDETYLGIFDPEYMESVDIDEEEAAETYRNSLEVEYGYLADNFSFDTDYLTEETYEAALDMIAGLYQNARYEVKPATKTENGFAVEVVIQPYDLIAVIADDHMETYSEGFRAKYDDVTQADIDAMGDTEAEAFWTEYENDWANGVLDLFKDNASAGSHLDGESIIVQMVADEDGYYSIADNDFANLDALILAYSK